MYRPTDEKGERGEITCEAAADLIEPFLDGDLGPSEAARLEAHLGRCADCAAELELATTLRRGLRSLPELDCPPAVLERARRAAGEAPVVPLRRPARRAPGWLAVAAALVLAALGALAVGRGLRGPTAEEPSPEQVAQATAEARYALALVGRVSRRAGLALRDDVLAPHVAGATAGALDRSLALAGLAGRGETAAGPAAGTLDPKPAGGAGGKGD